MRVLILHNDLEEAQSIRAAAWHCWGNPPLVQVDVAGSGSELLAKLARRSGWPDELIAVWRVLEREPSLITGLAQHPARGFFRTLIIVQGSDEYARATLWQAQGDLVMAPPTAERFIEAMTAFERVP